MDEVQKPPSGKVICIFCGGSNNLNQHKCSFCGRELPSTSSVNGVGKTAVNPENLICQACQHSNRPGSRYCAMCGTNLLGVTGSIPKSAFSNQRPLTAETSVNTNPPQQNHMLETQPAPTIEIQGGGCCPRCLLPYQAEAKVCKHCGYTGLSDNTVAGTPMAHTTIPSATAKHIAPALQDSPADLKDLNNSNMTCPVCGQSNTGNSLNCGNCGYSFTYHQEVSDRPVKQVKTWEAVGFIIFFIIFMFLIGIGFIYIFTS